MGSIKQDIRETVLGLTETAQEKMNDFIQFLKETWPLLIFLLILMIGFWWYADPPPPRRVLMATGSTGGSYEVLANKYVKFFEKKGITLELIKTTGADENLRRLADRNDPLQAAFVQAGIPHPNHISGIASLGAVDYEPIWFFYRASEAIPANFALVNDKMRYFLSKKISIGSIGSGTHVQAGRILEVSGFSISPNLINLPNHLAVQALKKGEVDGMFLADGFQSENVQNLLKDPSLRIISFQRAEAYSRLLPYLHILKVPMGGFSLIRNFPDKDLQMLATTTNLLIDNRMHPALQFLFLEAAREINGRSSFFNEHGEFPSFGHSGIPESSVALHYEKNGSPLLMTYFPFWIAELINRLVFVFLPFCALAYPVLLSLPGYRTKRMKRKIDKLYGVLKTYEQELTENFQAANINDYLGKLDLLEYDALLLQIPKSMSSDYYALRTNIDYVRNCLNRGVPPFQVQKESEDSI